MIKSNKYNISENPRIPYEDRTHWMAEIHYHYGSRCHLHDIDYVMSSEARTNSIWMEHMGNRGIALVEFKNVGEPIELYKYGQLIWLADGRDIPAYIVIGSQTPYIYYYIIPLNQACKRIPTLEKPRYFSEKNYVRFLHYLRKIKPKKESLTDLQDSLPPTPERFQINLK